MAELEAVHKINDWKSLKQRFSCNRTSYAVFHKAIPHEPLAFIYVLL